MAESQKYYLGDTVIYTQYLGTHKSGVYYDFPPFPSPVTSSLQIWLDAANTSSFTPGDSVWYDLVNTYNVGLEGVYTSGSTPTEFIDFDGDTGRGAIGNSPQFTGEFTLTTWFRIDVKGLNTVLGGSENSTQDAQGKILLYDNGDVQFRAVRNGASVRIPIGYDTGSMDGTWHQLNVKRDVNNWISASLDDGAWNTGSAAIGGTFKPVYVADSLNTGQNFDGAFSNMLIYTSSLSDADVLINYNYYAQYFI